LFFAGDLG